MRKKLKSLKLLDFIYASADFLAGFGTFASPNASVIARSSIAHRNLCSGRGKASQSRSQSTASGLNAKEKRNSSLVFAGLIGGTVFWDLT